MKFKEYLQKYKGFNKYANKEEMMFPEEQETSIIPDGTGLAKQIIKPLPVKEADPEQLEMGIEVEMEHTDIPEEAEIIALQHLAEDPEYYSKLATIEEGGPGSGKKGHTTNDSDEGEETKNEPQVEEKPDEYGEFSYNSNTKLENDIRSIFKEYKGEKTNEFDTLERIFYNMQDTGEFAFNKMKNIKQQLDILLKGGTPDLIKITTHFPPL